MGATLQILRLAGREHGVSEDRPWRIEDCISHLGLDACREAISTQTVVRGDHRQYAISECWAHAREVAQYSRALANEIADVNPDEAYLAGLLHAIGFLPELLGWRESGVVDGALAGLRLAKRWSLPSCVVEFFSEVQLTGYSTRWPGIVRKAHQNAKRPSMHCLFEQTMRPQLHRHG
jgi:HD-like signal output (HDOD) protein